MAGCSSCRGGGKGKCALGMGLMHKSWRGVCWVSSGLGMLRRSNCASGLDAAGAGGQMPSQYLGGESKGWEGAGGKQGV
jgi:hypothetical protein